MRKKLYVSPSTDPISIKSENFENKVILYAKEVLAAGADFLHCDIMDGRFVYNTTYDYKVVRKINSHCLIPLDVHLMVSNPSSQISKYIKAGANFLTLHFEAFENKNKLIKKLQTIRKKHLLSGISFKPQTSVEAIEDYLGYCDIVLVMSVEPGMSGQKFIQSTYEKIKKLNDIRKKGKYSFFIEVDGGVTPEIANQVRKLGADIVVSGSYVYNSKNREESIKSLRGL